MNKRPLKRSSVYKSRVRTYAFALAERYRVEIAETFLARVKEAENLVYENNLAGTPAPYILADRHVVLRELYFQSGPATYCLIYEVSEEYVGLISLWHGSGSRKSLSLQRMWRR